MKKPTNLPRKVSGYATLGARGHAFWIPPFVDKTKEMAMRWKKMSEDQYLCRITISPIKRIKK